MTAIERGLASVIRGEALALDLARDVMQEMLSPGAPATQIAALLTGLRIKGESDEELFGFAQVMRSTGLVFPVNGQRIDTCGTGGDGIGTFNISTAVAIVLASMGIPVVKHGNRAVSSKSGSADVLSALGIRIDAPMEKTQEAFRSLGIAFLFAPRYHPAMKQMAHIRRELGVRTVFNLLGPLVNPGTPTHQLLGVFDDGRIEQMARVLSRLGTQSAWVVHGEGGLDEVSIAGETRVAVLDNGVVETWSVMPEAYDVVAQPLSSLAGGDAEYNGAKMLDVLGGEQGAYRDAVILNAASALCVFEGHRNTREAAARVRAALDSGQGVKLVEAWRAAL